MLKKFTEDFGFMTVEDSVKLDSMSDGYVSQNDSRLSNDRVASGIRTATTAVSVSSAAAPTIGQVITATGGSSAQWQTPIPSIAAGEVFYLDGYTLPDGYQLTPTSQYTPGSEITLSAVIYSGQTVGLGTFVSEVPIGEPFVQQGEWAFDTFASVDNNDGYVTIEIDGYSRSLSNVDAYLFTTTTSIINGNTSALYSSNPFEGMFPVTSTDRLVIKYRATKTGGSGTTTITLHFQDNTNASHVHTPIGVAQYATGLQTASMVVIISDAAAPTPGQVLTAINGTSADWEGGTVTKGSRTPLTPGSGIHVLLSLPITASTDNKIQVIWDCYDGTATSRVLGSQFITVIRESTSAPIIPAGGNVVGADFIDTTTNLSTPWAPTCALNGNNLEIRLTADVNNGVVPGVSATVIARVNSDAPAPADPIIVARSALVASGFAALQLDAYLGLTPSSPSPGTNITAWADQSTNHNNGTKAGVNNITYQVDGYGKPYLQYPATNATFNLGSNLSASHTQTFAFAYDSNGAFGNAIEVILASDIVNEYITVNFSSDPGACYYNDGTGAKKIGTIPAGKHYNVIVVDAVNATLYVDGTPQTPTAIVTATNVWSNTCIGGKQGDPTSFPLLSGRISAIYVAADALNTAARVTAFDTYCTAAFGAHS